MKKSKFPAAFAAAVLFTIAVVVVVSCQKTPDVQKPEVTGMDDESTDITQHILDFKERMELYRDNTGLKTEQKYTADSAVTELENLINFDFGYGMLQVNKQEIVYSEITMSLDASSKIGESDLSAFYYDQLIEEIQNQMLGLSGYDSIKLMFVDLKHKETNGDGDAVISINSFIGNEGAIASSSTEIGWRFGFGQGDCDLNGNLDAAILLEQELNKYKTDDLPPSGYVWRWTDPVTVGPLEPLKDKYKNLNDDDEEDNYQDRLIFYATAKYNEEFGYVLTSNDKCVSTDAEIGWNLEMHFYNISYSHIGDDVMVETDGNQWNIDIVEDDDYDDDDGNYHYVKHDLWITTSYKYAAPEDEVAVEDILEY